MWRTLLKEGDYVISKDTRHKWLHAVIVKIKENRCFIHYLGWQNKWDIWVDISSPDIKQVECHVLSYNEGCHIIKYFVKKLIIENDLRYGLSVFVKTTFNKYSKIKTKIKTKTTNSHKTFIDNDKDYVLYKDLRKLVMEFIPQHHVKLSFSIKIHGCEHCISMSVNLCMDEYFKNGSLDVFENIGNKVFESLHKMHFEGIL